MRIAIVTNDSRGGVQPYVALGLGLLAAGHDVRAVAPGDLASLFRDADIPVAPLSGSVQDVIARSNGATERGLVAGLRLAARELPRVMTTWLHETLAGCEGADVVTGGIGGMGIGMAVAQHLGVPFVETHVQPLGAPTGAYPGLLAGGAPPWIGPWGRRLSHHVSEAVFWASIDGPARAARRRVFGQRGRVPRSGDGAALYGFSRHVVPLPATPGRERRAVGYWTLPVPSSWTPPHEIAAFLDLDDRPVAAVGFGSMGTRDPAALTGLVRDAARDAGVRVILLSGWGGLGRPEVDDDLVAAESLPHEWLFPRVSMVVHHGGAGTTGAGLRAGVPSIVVPFTMDQPFWASRVAALGVGPAPLPRRRLAREGLAAALRQARDDRPMRARAADLGARLRAEDGVGEAVRHFATLA